MSAKIKCPGCAKTRQVPESKLGSKLKCPDCGNVFVAQESSSGKSKSSSGAKKKKKSKSSNSTLLVGLLVGGVIAVGFGAFLIFGRGDKENSPLAPGTNNASTTTPTTNGTTSVPTALAQIPASSGAGAMAALGWMTPDPAKEFLEWTNELKTEIHLNLGEHSPFLPDRPSPFVGFQSMNGMSVYDLRTNKQVGHVDYEQVTFFDQTLSPDGTRFAALAQVSSTGGAAPSNMLPTHFQVWSTESGKPLGAPHPIPDGKLIVWSNFRTTNELVMMMLATKFDPAKRNTEGLMFDTKGDKTLQSFSFPERVSRNKYHLSPGDRYLICENTYVLKGSTIDHSQIVALELATGKVVGRANTQGQNDSLTVDSFAFSPDGKQLAVLLRMSKPDSFRVIFLETSTGQKTHEIPIAGDGLTLLKGRLASVYRNELGLNWLPGTKHLILFNSLVVEIDGGKIVLDLREPPDKKEDVVFNAFVLGNTLVKYIQKQDGYLLKSQKIEIP